LPGFGVVVAIALLSASRTASQETDPVATTRITLRNAKTQATKQPRPSLVSREAYFRRREIVDVRLSPDGRHLSFLRRTDKGLDLTMQNVSSGAETRIVAGLRRAETAWSGDGRRLWIADDQGLAVMESAGLSAKRILKWDPRKKQKLWAVDARAPRYAIMHERVAQHGAERHRYLRVDEQGKTHLLLEAALPVRNALLNAKGELVFTAAFDGSRFETVIRKYTAGAPRELLRCGSIQECRLVGYNEAQKTLWLHSQHGEDKLALQRWQEKSGRWDTVHRDPDAVADADAVVWSAAQENWLAIAYHGGRRRWYGNGSDTRARLTSLERQLPEANLRLSPTIDGRLWLVHAQQSDRAMDRHYLYRPELNRLQRLFAREEVSKRMPPPGAVMHPVSYRARDGMLLHGYVLLPGGIAPGKAPLIAWLHGGPIARTFDRFDASMQLLVNRGNAVFVPNFRASAGYGLRYVLSARGDVGNGRVLADIIDGMDFLLVEGIGDRARQAVMGMSFGGYASLLALSHHPARFRFAFAGAPPTEYGWTKQWQAEHDSEALRAEGAPLSLLFPLLGFPYEDAAWREKMRRESPLAALGALRAPAYIWAGERDDHVPIKSIVHYVGEARRRGKPLSLLIDPAAGHAPENLLGAEAFLYLLETAAHRHFGSEVSPVSPELRAFLSRNTRIDIHFKSDPKRPQPRSPLP